ncbi:MAG: hypothetical protein ACPGGK_13865 [Pikeienuella sp.]
MTNFSNDHMIADPSLAEVGAQDSLHFTPRAPLRQRDFGGVVAMTAVAEQFSTAQDHLSADQFVFCN